MSTKIIVLLLLALASTSVRAEEQQIFSEDEIIGMEMSGLSEHQSARKDITERTRLVARSQKALNNLVRAGTNRLKKVGDTSYVQWQRAWDTQFSSYLLQFQDYETKDVGDHAPLSKFLTDFYNKLEATLGKQVCESLRLSDIKVFNYTIPVVFHPRGFNGDVWDMGEYRKHFVPFSGAITYWATLGGCTGAVYLGVGGLSNAICSPLANMSRFGMENIFAPPLSDIIYRAANKK